MPSVNTLSKLKMLIFMLYNLNSGNNFFIFGRKFNTSRDKDQTWEIRIIG